MTFASFNFCLSLYCRVELFVSLLFYYFFCFFWPSMEIFIFVYFNYFYFPLWLSQSLPCIPSLKNLENSFAKFCWYHIAKVFFKSCGFFLFKEMAIFALFLYTIDFALFKVHSSHISWKGERAYLIPQNSPKMTIFATLKTHSLCFILFANTNQI